MGGLVFQGPFCALSGAGVEFVGHWPWYTADGDANQFRLADIDVPLKLVLTNYLLVNLNLNE